MGFTVEMKIYKWRCRVKILLEESFCVLIFVYSRYILCIVSAMGGRAVDIYREYMCT